MNRTVLIAIVVLLLAGLSYLVSKNVEYYDERVDIGWSNKAKLNKYLALERYLEKKSLLVESLVRIPLSEKLANADALVVPAANQIQLQSQKRMILDWVNNGGLLMLGVGYGDEPPILGDLLFSKRSRIGHHEGMNGVEDDGVGDESLDNAEDKEDAPSQDKSLADMWREENKRIQEEYTKRKDKHQADEQSEIHCQIPGRFCGKPEVLDIHESRITVMSMNNGEDARLHVDGAFFLEHPAFDGVYGDAFIEINEVTAEVVHWNGTQKGVTHAELSFGAGAIHIFSDLNFLTNHEILHADHAFLVDQLIGTKNAALIVFGKEMPSLAQLVYQYFFEALVAGFVIIICALAYFGRRLGNIEQLLMPSRRSRAERFNAVASFRWQNNDRESLLHSAREHILKKADKRWLGFQQWPLTEQARMLSEHSQLNQAAVEKALFDANEFNETTFIHIINVLQALRNCL